MDKEQMENEPQPWEFRSKPAWQRFIVMIAGIIMNLVIGIIIFAAWLGNYEKGYTKPSEVSIIPTELGAKHGFKEGDKVLAVNGKTINRYKDAESIGTLFGSEFLVERNGEKVEFEVPDVFHPKQRVQLFQPDADHIITVNSFSDTSFAFNAGMKEGDIIKKINGKPISRYPQIKDEFRSHLANSSGDAKVNIEVLRDGKVQNIPTQVTPDATVGFRPSVVPVLEKTPYTFFDLFRYGTKEGWESIYYNAIGIGKMFKGELPVMENLQSPVGIARNIYGGKWIGKRFWYVTGLLSFILAFMNILPIPALDGGHMVFLGIEMITGKPVSDRVLMIAQTVGMFILIPLMLLIIGKDTWQAVQEWLFK